jgi:hypothetical protein
MQGRKTCARTQEKQAPDRAGWGGMGRKAHRKISIAIGQCPDSWECPRPISSFCQQHMWRKGVKGIHRSRSVEDVKSGIGVIEEVCKVSLWKPFHPHTLVQSYPQSSVSFTGEFSPKTCLKNMISIYRKGFSWEKWPKFARFRIFFTNRQIFIICSSR